MRYNRDKETMQLLLFLTFFGLICFCIGLGVADFKTYLQEGRCKCSTVK